MAGLALLLLGGCSVLMKPDMSRTMEIARLRRPSHPLIVIPGFLGSKLRDPRTGEVLWGTMANVLSHDQSHLLACPIESGGPEAGVDDLEPFALYESLWGIEYYRKSMRILREAGGYQLGDIAHPKPGDNAFVFLYDWRKDIVESARLLSQSLDNLKSSLGDPGLKFDVLAHSQGGLVARYYAKYGSADVLGSPMPPPPSGEGARNLNKVILLGTPNQGTLEAFRILHKGLKKVFRPMPPSVTFTMPALYEMLPPPGASILSDLEGKPVPLDLYDPETWVGERFSVFSDEEQAAVKKEMRSAGANPAYLEARNGKNRAFLGRILERARRFHAALRAPLPEGQPVAYYAFGSDCIPTLKSAVAVDEKSGRRIYLDPERHGRDRFGERLSNLLYGPGDGTVLMESLLNLPEIHGSSPAPPGETGVRLSSAFFVCESHGLLPNNPIFQSNLLYLLLYDADPLAALPREASPTNGS